MPLEFPAQEILTPEPEAEEEPKGLIEQHQLAADIIKQRHIENRIKDKSKPVTIVSPTSSEDVSMFFTTRALTIKKMLAVTRGTSPSLTWTIRHGIDRSATGAEVVTGGTTTTTESGESITTFNDPTIIANSYVWLESTAESGTTNEFHTTIIYTVDP